MGEVAFPGKLVVLIGLFFPVIAKTMTFIALVSASSAMLGISIMCALPWTAFAFGAPVVILGPAFSAVFRKRKSAAEIAAAMKALVGDVRDDGSKKRNGKTLDDMFEEEEMKEKAAWKASGFAGEEGPTPARLAQQRRQRKAAKLKKQKAKASKESLYETLFRKRGKWSDKPLAPLPSERNIDAGGDPPESSSSSSSGESDRDDGEEASAARDARRARREKKKAIAAARNDAIGIRFVGRFGDLFEEFHSKAHYAFYGEIIITSAISFLDGYVTAKSGECPNMVIILVVLLALYWLFLLVKRPWLALAHNVFFIALATFQLALAVMALLMWTTSIGFGSEKLLNAVNVLALVLQYVLFVKSLLDIVVLIKELLHKRRMAKKHLPAPDSDDQFQDIHRVATQAARPTPLTPNNNNRFGDRGGDRTPVLVLPHAEDLQRGDVGGGPTTIGAQRNGGRSFADRRPEMANNTSSPASGGRTGGLQPPDHVQFVSSATGTRRGGSRTPWGDLRGTDADLSMREAYDVDGGAGPDGGRRVGITAAELQQDRHNDLQRRQLQRNRGEGRGAVGVSPSSGPSRRYDEEDDVEDRENDQRRGGRGSPSWRRESQVRDAPRSSGGSSRAPPLPRREGHDDDSDTNVASTPSRRTSSRNDRPERRNFDRDDADRSRERRDDAAEEQSAAFPDDGHDDSIDDYRPNIRNQRGGRKDRAMSPPETRRLAPSSSADAAPRDAMPPPLGSLSSWARPVAAVRGPSAVARYTGSDDAAVEQLDLSGGAVSVFALPIAPESTASHATAPASRSRFAVPKTPPVSSASRTAATTARGGDDASMPEFDDDDAIESAL